MLQCHPLPCDLIVVRICRVPSLDLRGLILASILISYSQETTQSPVSHPLLLQKGCKTSDVLEGGKKKKMKIKHFLEQ